MKRSLRSGIVAAALALWVGVPLVPAQAQNPKFDSTFTQVQKIAADQPSRAIDEYGKIKNQSKDPAVASEALLRAALLGYNTVTQPQPELAKLPSEARSEREQANLDTARKAHDALKQMLQQYPDSEAAKTAETPRFGKNARQTLLEALESDIDAGNASNLNYKILDALVALTGRIPAFSYWFALLLIAVIVKGITMPLTLKMYKSQREMQRMQPILKQLQEKYKDNKVELQEKQMAAFKEHGVNPMASCLPMLVQMPFLYWIYYVIRLYEFHFANGKFLWIGSPLSHQFPKIVAGNLAQFDIPLLCLYAASNYLTMKLTPATDPQAAQTQKTTSVMMTVVMFWMFMTYKWSAAFIFYWLVLNAISAWQQYTYIYKPRREEAASGGGGNPGLVLPAASNGKLANGTGGQEARATAAPRPTTPVPNDTMRARPRRKRR